MAIVRYLGGFSDIQHYAHGPDARRQGLAYTFLPGKDVEVLDPVDIARYKELAKNNPGLWEVVEEG